MTDRVTSELGPEAAEILRAMMATRNFESEAEAMRAALREWAANERQRREQLSALHEAIDTGLASGTGREFDAEAFLARKHAQHAE